MEDNKLTYNSDDFARYHEGIMPADEMFALEKAALEDPFLADALEGYLFSKDTKAELSDLQIRLAEKGKSKKRGAVFQLSQSAWWRIAAMFTGIILVGYLFFQSRNLEKTASLAQTESAKLTEQQTLVSRAKSDTIDNKNDIAINNVPALNENENSKVQPSIPITKSRSTDLKKVPTPILESSATTGSVEEIKPDLISDVASAKALNFQNAELAQKNDRDRMVATAGKEKARMEIFPPPEKTLQARLRDTTISSVADSNDFLAIHENSKLDSLNALSLANSKPEISEVVVVDYAKKKKSGDAENISRELGGKVSGVSIGASKPYLLDGQQKFDQYIKANSQLFSTFKTKIDSVDILLSFILDKNKRPSKIKVLESNCKACDEEAIRLLKNGPKWGGESGSGGTIKIQF